MNFTLTFTETAEDSLRKLKKDKARRKQFKAVRKALKYLAINPKHPSLQTHLFYSKLGPNRKKIFEAYAEQDTPGAYRIFFYYGSGRKEITIFAIVKHP